MIGSFKHKGLKRLYERNDGSKLPPKLVERIRDVLTDMEASEDLAILDRPSLRLHPLSGDRKGQWAVRVNANWRITFEFRDGTYFNVDFVDYH